MSALAAKSERTRRELVSAARRAFAEHGYDEVSLRDITESLGLTKGAMYHHFASKEELFERAVEQVEEEMFLAIAAEVEKHEASVDRFIASCTVFLREATMPSRARLLLIDGPVVLGWARWIDIVDAPDMRGRLARTCLVAVEEAVAESRQTPLSRDVLVQFISGGTMQMARWVCIDREARLETGLAQLETALRRLVNNSV